MPDTLINYLAFGVALWLIPWTERAGGDFQMRAKTHAELRAPVAGFLDEIYCDEGQQVTPGSTVAQLWVMPWAKKGLPFESTSQLRPSISSMWMKPVASAAVAAGGASQRMTPARMRWAKDFIVNSEWWT